MRYHLSLIAPILIVFAVAPGTAQPAETRLGSVSVAGVSVAGLTPHEARARLAQRLAPKLNAKIVLTDGVKRLPRTRRQLGVSLDTAGMVARAKGGARRVPLRLTAEPAAVQRALRGIAPRFRSAPRNARVVERGGNVRIDPGAHGRTVDVAQSAQRLAAAVRKEPALRTFRLVIDKKAPPLSAARLKGINGVLGRFTTRFNTGELKRSHNIRLAIRAIDGTLLSPGEVFSLNQSVGERTQKRGYRTAPVFENRKLVPGIGGGVSQVTGTLFNAALLAGLPIVEYGTHSKPVPYIPIGRDATVAWNATDLKFRNNTSAPVMVAYRATGSRLTATLYGARKPGRRVSVMVRKQQRGPRHLTAQLFRTVRQNGKVVRKEQVGKSVYRWKPQAAD